MTYNDMMKSLITQGYLDKHAQGVKHLLTQELIKRINDCSRRFTPKDQKELIGYKSHQNLVNVILEDYILNLNLDSLSRNNTFSLKE